MNTIAKRRGIMFRGYIFLPDKEYLRVVNDELEGTGSSISKVKPCQTQRDSWIIVYIQSQTSNHYSFFIYELIRKLKELDMYKDFKKLNTTRKGITK